MKLEYRKSKKQRVIFYSLIIDVSKITEAFGSVKAFVKKYDITGVTNGELLILYFMSYPEEYIDYLVNNIFAPNSFEENRDYLLVQEELVLGVYNRPSKSLYHPLSSLNGINWLGSIINKKGNWVWKM